MKRFITATIILIMIISLIMVFCGCNENSTKQESVDNDFDLLSQVLQFINENYIDGLDVNEADIYAALGVVAGLDNYSNLYSYSSLLAGSGSSAGIGVMLSISTYHEYVISHILPGSPASAEQNAFSLQRGDEIYAVNGKRISGASNTVFSEYSAGGAGTVLTLTIKRDGSILEYEPSYTKVNTTFAQCLYVNDLEGIDTDMGYIWLRSFDSTTDVIEEFISAAAAFKADNNEALILDLRNNPGGSDSVLSAIAAYLIGAPADSGGSVDIISIERMYKGEAVTNTIKANPSEDYLDVPIYVLCNGSTASASEALIGAMKANGTLTELIGSNTYGKGVCQNSVVMGSDNTYSRFIDYITNGDGERVANEAYYISIVVGKYYILDDSVSGGKYSINGNPFEPTIGVTLPDDYRLTSDYSDDLFVAAAENAYQSLTEH